MWYEKEDTFVGCLKKNKNNNEYTVGEEIEKMRLMVIVGYIKKVWKKWDVQVEIVQKKEEVKNSSKNYGNITK